MSINEYWQLENDISKETVRFDQDMRWIDEFNWSKIAQAAPVYTLTGAMDIQQGIKKAGRPITLSGEWVWHKRKALETLRNWSDTAELTMTLTHYDQREFAVMFRLHESAMAAEPVFYQTPETATEPYLATINLIQVAKN